MDVAPSMSEPQLKRKYIMNATLVIKWKLHLLPAVDMAFLSIATKQDGA
jgi:hypothetical protein